MGNSGWDDDSWRRGRSSRDARSPDADRSQSRAPRGPTRGGDDRGSRGSPNGHERGRGYERPGSSGSSGRGGWGDDERSGSSSRNGGRGAPGSGRSRPLGREDYEDGRGADRSMRGPRPPTRDDGQWRDGPPRHRHRPDGPPGASSGRNHSPDRGGGLWGDDGARSRRHGPGAGPGAAGAGAARGGMRPDPRDPRLARRPMGAVATAGEDEEEDESNFGIGKAMLVILMMFAVGIVAGFGYFRLSAPQVHGGGNDNTPQQNSTPSASPSASPSTTPSATGTGTPHADAHPANASSLIASSAATPAYVIVVRSIA